MKKCERGIFSKGNLIDRRKEVAEEKGNITTVFLYSYEFLCKISLTFPFITKMLKEAKVVLMAQLTVQSENIH